MGSFYTNYTLRGPSQTAVAKALAGSSAMVSPESGGCVVVFKLGRLLAPRRVERHQISLLRSVSSA